MNKNEIRKQILNKRDSFEQREIDHKSRRIFDKLVGLSEYRDADNILVYASYGSEVKTDEIMLDALAGGKNVFCPKVIDKKNGKMEFIRISSIEDLQEGFHGIREPQMTENSEVFGYSDSASAENTGNTLAIVPGVAFDRANDRIGYNGGFYDRFFSAHKDVRKVAVCYDIQLVDEKLPVESHDIPMDAVISD